MFVRDYLVQGTDLKSELTTIEPPIASYREMKKALLTYLRLAKEDERGAITRASRHGVFRYAV